MTTLREAATQALEAMEGGSDSWQLVGPAIDALKAALVEDAMQKFTDVSQEIEAALAEPVQKPGDFDHGIGADRFKVVRGAFWWHVLIGDSPTKHGKFHSRASAEKMAADLLREFRNGAFVQHEAALAEPVQEPVQDGKCKHCVDGCPACDARKLPVQEPVAYAVGRTLHWHEGKGVSDAQLFAAPPQRPAEPVQEPVAKCIDDICSEHLGRVEAFDHLPRGTLLYAILPQRKPLTDDAIEKAYREIWRDLPSDFDHTSAGWIEMGIKYAERAHGII